ncbi:CPBP family intramembrane glutamic endopeptidase [Musicola keenii]|uniref:CPBP family intramembrane glutamic endopeptidase n=1 Tax=Musicola keenii TaxID=2884250 RepID=UPI00177F41AE|nr:type II CAAX endopeptidase family protein [Musicola keenii]
MNPPSDKVIHSLVCLAVFLAWFALSLLFTVLPGYRALYRAGLATPLLYLAIWLPFVLIAWRQYQKHYGLMPLGKLHPGKSLLPMLALLLLALIHGLFGKPERWMMSLPQMPSLSLYLLIPTMCLLAPVIEEVIFRGFLLNARLGWGKHATQITVILTSLIFSLSHAQYLSPTTFVWLFVFSIILCQLRLHTNSLLAPIVLHALNNMLSITAVLAAG